MFQQAPLVAILLSHLTPDRLLQSLSLFERYHRRADSVRERTEHILLAEDRAELVSQSALDAQARYEAALQSALDPITAETLNALRSTLGDRGFDAYQEYAGAWLRGLIPEE